MYPDDLKYTAEHEWTRDEGQTVAIGITSFAQEALGDIVYVQLPATGTAIRAGDVVGEVESTKSVSDVYAPISGVVTERNGALDARPELINEDPYGEGWLFRVTPESTDALDGLLDAAAYAAQIQA
ncbi:MAG: glycine cleavage system protein [Frankiaceae bacterium]|nr:glycine cleavage system protein [Frankiaceae bacterium]MDQ1725075.1 glycine cleavage system protein [Frankiaceae bacterium]